MIKTKIIILIFYGFISIFSSISNIQDLIPEIQGIIQKGVQNIWNQIELDEPLWNMPPWLGTFFISQYYFQLKAIQFNSSIKFQTKFNTTFFKEKLLKEQLNDGSWRQLVDLNQKKGSLDATIFNYWFLKDIGVDQSSQMLKKAQRFILAHGGIQQAQMMTKYKLAVFGQYKWQSLNYIPLFLFKNNSFPFYSYGYIKSNIFGYEDYVAQWVYPHLLGLAYLRYQKTIFPISQVCLSELFTQYTQIPCLNKNDFIFDKPLEPLKRQIDVDILMNEAMMLYGRRGSFGAYTISTLLCLLSFKDYSLRYQNQTNQIISFYHKNVEKSFIFIQDMYFNRRVPYQGSLDDGRYWDTILASYALLEAGQQPHKLHKTIKYLVQTAVQQSGGIPYGHQFEYAPDIDDTALLLALHGKMKNFFQINTVQYQFYKKQIDRTYKWIIGNQNSDGGFPAFDKNKNQDNYLIKKIFQLTNIDKSAQIFDPSCPDIVGHILQGMGQAQIYDQKPIIKMINYLSNSKKDDMWSARWGINYVYAVGAVYPGLSKIGFDFQDQDIKQVTKRLISIQQHDGGFGQNQQSYNIDKYLQGIPTVSMTAWGLLAYLQTAHAVDVNQNIIKAAKFIINNFKENNNRFYDVSVVGTGHRGILNLQYPVYAYSFPLIALSRLRSLIKGHKKVYINQKLMKAYYLSKQDPSI